MANEHTVNHVRPLLHYFIQRVLPLVYDDSLSYYEVLSKVIAKLNELIEQNNQIADNLVEVFKAWLESPEGVAAIEEAIGASVGDITVRLAQAEADIDSLQAQLPTLTSAVAEAQRTATQANSTANAANQLASQASANAVAAQNAADTAQDSADLANGSIMLQSGRIDALANRMTSAEQTNTEQGQSITALTNDLTAVRQNVTANASNITALRHKVNPMQAYNSGANIVFLGDSWTAGVQDVGATSRYPYLLARALGMTEKNFGIQAAGFAKRPNKIATGITDATSGMTAAERTNTAIVVIMGGVNDTRWATEDSLTYDEFASAVLSCVASAHSTFPNALIVTAVGNAIQHGTSPTHINWFMNTNRRLSLLTYPVLVIDNMFDIVAGTSNYLSDALHPNATGNAWIAHYLLNAITGGDTTVRQFIAGGTTLYSNAIMGSMTGGGLPNLWKENRKYILTPSLLHFNQDVSTNQTLGSVPAYTAPMVNVYGGFYYGNARVGDFVITTSGAIHVIPDGHTLTQGYPAQMEWLAY